jgi:hypothetical protein
VLLEYLPRAVTVPAVVGLDVVEDATAALLAADTPSGDP